MEFVLSNQFRSNQIKCTYVEDLDRHKIYTHTLVYLNFHEFTPHIFAHSPIRFITFVRT